MPQIKKEYLALPDRLIPCVPYSQATDLLWKAVSLTHAEGMKLLRPVQIDPGFLKFHNYALKHHIPFTVISCGLDLLFKSTWLGT